MRFFLGQIFVNGFSSFSCFNFSFLYTKKHRFFSINWQVCLIFLDSFLVSVFQRQILSRFFCRYLHIFVLTFGGKFNNSSRKWQFLSTTLIFRRFFSKINLHRFFCCRYLRDFFVLLHNYLRLVRVTRRAFLKHSIFFDVFFHSVVQHAIYRCKIDKCFGSLALLSFFFE